MTSGVIARWQIQQDMGKASAAFLHLNTIHVPLQSTFITLFYHCGGFVGPVPILELSRCYICRLGCTGIMSGMSTCKCKMSGRLAEWTLTLFLSHFWMFIVICLFSRLYGDEQAID